MPDLTRMLPMCDETITFAAQNSSAWNPVRIAERDIEHSCINMTNSYWKSFCVVKKTLNFKYGFALFNPNIRKYEMDVREILRYSLIKCTIVVAIIK